MLRKVFLSKSTKSIGDRFEKVAANYLKGQGVTLISKNFTAKYGEIDLIGLERDILVFFEVRARSSTNLGRPEETVTAQKQQRIRRTADKFLQTNTKYRNTLCRFDVISIVYSDTQHSIDWITNAFQ